jgi:hypothetical protein
MLGLGCCYGCDGHFSLVLHLTGDYTGEDGHGVGSIYSVGSTCWFGGMECTLRLHVHGHRQPGADLHGTSDAGCTYGCGSKPCQVVVLVWLFIWGCFLVCLLSLIAHWQWLPGLVQGWVGPTCRETKCKASSKVHGCCAISFVRACCLSGVDQGCTVSLQF